MMASDETMTINSSMHEDIDEEDTYEEDEDQHHPHNLSRLSICSSSKHSMYDLDDVASGGDMMMMYMSGLSIDQSSYGDIEADDESSDDHKGVHHDDHMFGASSDSDKEMIGSCISLPGTPLQVQQYNKEYYFSENEATTGKTKTKRNSSSRKKAIRERWLDSEWEKKKYRAKSMDGESESLMITRPNGGKKSMCMDLGEVKACRDLGFELEHLKMLEIPNQNSCSTIDTASSGGNSPISSWRISSPGDDPKDVKARLKVWAQAVAASASRLVG
ncbi:Fold protein [Thalictrum thalictroides]|uniref:Fold protein n=1 Tax=Thalictrum thalictroides TaxID=46969 RepID=A0A7J6X6G2_THATH|nr:Fold protein [Thalictrum thalictroides]